jgi:nucleotide-binding universal stress UspA family protein
VGPIVCATRGGEASRRTQERATAMAKERGTRLVFLYVVDPSFAEGIDGEMTETLIDELRRLGRSLLRLAQLRANEQGKESDAAIRKGPVLDAIEDFIREVDASTLVVGSPRGQEEPRTFEADQLDEFTRRIESATGAQVVVVE